MQKILHVLSVVVTQTIDITLSIGSLPQHYTTEMVGIEGHIDEQNIFHLLRLDIISGIRCIFSSWETDEKLCIRVGASPDDPDPLGEVETSTRVVRCRATVRIVELDPNEIEYRAGNSVVELLVRNTALGRTRDIEGLIGVLFEVASETVDHRSPSCPSLVVLLGSRKEINLPVGPLFSISKSKPSTEFSWNGRGKLVAEALYGPNEYHRKSANQVATSLSSSFSLGESPPIESMIVFPFCLQIGRSSQIWWQPLSNVVLL